ncbi:TlpA family protein disulfide reductase [Flavihumibacter petaseus]|uniref:Thioredoxin domain-containing protein n=1 Tax=Flavihumibacter petaseus NBRC 106054 TaxID=1220578 RepID=A0A0E9MWT5_9BACT|nr:TlpA family protein disulfide reductase [Flavihumibacter petaseus]GAO42049.1 hypothetical protein FPE01S_01_10620 [Flavihumibacter petaseus NBRC 106054]
MKNRVLYLFAALLCGLTAVAQKTVPAATTGSAGYRLTVGINAWNGQYLYLGYHYGKIKALADSALVKGNSAIFSGAKPLPGGIYFLVSPKKEIMYELLLDKQQQFSMHVDTAHPEAPVFKDSKDNADFQAYTQFIQSKGTTLNQAQEALKNAPPADTARLHRQIREGNAAILDYRKKYIQGSPNSFLTVLFNALSEPVIPPAAEHPGGVYDSSYAYKYFKQHYWDGIRLTDERLLRTPFFESRLDRYFKDLVSQEPDSIKKEVDWFLTRSKPNNEMYKYLLTHFVQAYINPQYMGQDAVYVHLFEKYINQHPEVDWFTEKYRKYMNDRAYSLMANLIGNPAWDLNMTDTTGKAITLYEIAAPYTVVCFWDATCSHCKEMVPRLDSMFQHKWKQQGIKLLGIMTDGGKENWLNYIRQNNLKDWIHVYQTDEQRETERNSGKPGYRQLYDVYQTPVLYLLDKEKRIIAKKLSYQQMDDLIMLKQKNANSRK